jgi:hypothetical protein
VRLAFKPDKSSEEGAKEQFKKHFVRVQHDQIISEKELLRP